MISKHVCVHGLRGSAKRIRVQEARSAERAGRVCSAQRGLPHAVRAGRPDKSLRFRVQG